MKIPFTEQRLLTYTWVGLIFTNWARQSGEMVCPDGQTATEAIDRLRKSSWKCTIQVDMTNADNKKMLAYWLLSPLMP